MEKAVESVAAKENKVTSQAKQITLDAIFVALTLVFTAFVNVQVPSFGGAGGLIHLGNVPLFVAAMLFGKRTGALAGGLGMGLFDLLSGWALWAPCTFITCGLMGFVVGAICTKWKGYGAKIVAMFAALGIKLAGYYIFEAFIMGNGMAAALKSVPGNIIQVGMAAIIVLIIIEPLSMGVRAIRRD
ncbi:MAG: ECF transporter S component [Lachnospiraceae bacterium]